LKAEERKIEPRRTRRIRRIRRTAINKKAGALQDFSVFSWLFSVFSVKRLLLLLDPGDQERTRKRPSDQQSAGGNVMAVSINPSVDNGIQPTGKDFAGGTLVCKCTDKPVKVSIKSQIAHNHAC